MRLSILKLASTVTMATSLIVAVVSLAAGATMISVFIRAATALLTLGFLSLLIHRISLPAEPDPPMSPPADNAMRGTRIDLLAGDER
jgi:hypothetical protein